VKSPLVEQGVLELEALVAFSGCVFHLRPTPAEIYCALAPACSFRHATWAPPLAGLQLVGITCRIFGAKGQARPQAGAHLSPGGQPLYPGAPEAAPQTSGDAS
jgi:hypothetical protein